MSSNAKRAEDARQRGNDFYKSHRINDDADDDPQKQKLLARLTKAKLYLSEPANPIAQESVRNAIFQLPKYRPHLNDDRGYFRVGHDEMNRSLRDARNLLQTMSFYAFDRPKPTQRLHMTILDHTTAMLARDLICFCPFRRGLLNYRIASSRRKQLYHQTTLATIQRLLDSFAKQEQPISWVYGPVAVQDAVRYTLESWMPVPTGPYSIQRIRQLMAEDNLGSGQELVHLKFDHPRLSAYVDSEWSFNITLVDIGWENANPELGISPNPDLVTLPFMIVDLLTRATNAITVLRNRMIVEVCLGEMSEVLERMQHEALDGPTEPGSKNGLASPLTETIPSDYVGGPLTSFLYGTPILEHGRLKLSAETPEDNGPFPLVHYLLWERIPQQPMSFEQLKPQEKFLHWLYTQFMKLCHPYPRPKFDQALVYAPLNMTVFLRLVGLVSELGYPAHWLSKLIDSILSVKIITTARPPALLPQMMLTWYIRLEHFVRDPGPWSSLPWQDYGRESCPSNWWCLLPFLEQRTLTSTLSPSLMYTSGTLAYHILCWYSTTRKHSDHHLRICGRCS
ncbi:hypothetical protein CROQUDRAFT_106917 [Cronartium quercuum f. sp. fusiforme G11]|uniref:Uncharacterized protein n=1 Tax=Cronartium quercuum f. sp. fusiforme G11 TaxID=708437 RepID=A0A9P6NGY8_9BASI|nr:hypothetical protein CROQUDRAFT_106917 [Cronartium quercuum f. sp. fusiforme G11]